MIGPAATEDGRRVRGDRTRRAILRAAVNIASVEGLEGLSIGRLATELNMSKSGLFAHFGSKEELQISTVRAAAAIFVQRVVRPAQEEHEPGLARLRVMLDIWLDYMEAGIFAGGCFFAAATAEMDGRARAGARCRRRADQRLDRPARRVGRATPWHAASCARTPIPTSSPSSSTRSAPRSTAVWQLHGDPVVFERGHRALRRRLEADATDAGRAVLGAS